MSKKQDRIAITNNVIAAARAYKAHMVGNIFMYVFENRYIEVIYRSRDFLHLTGVDTNLSAESFYKKAVEGTLRSNQIFFTQRHPYDLCLRKNRYIRHLSTVTNSNLLVLKDVTTNTATFQFGVTELSFLLCLDQIRDTQGQPTSNLYIAKSLRDGDGFDRCADAFELNYIFQRKNNEKLYSRIMFSDQKASLSSLPPQIRQKIDLDK